MRRFLNYNTDNSVLIKVFLLIHLFCYAFSYRLNAQATFTNNNSEFLLQPSTFLYLNGHIVNSSSAQWANDGQIYITGDVTNSANYSSGTSSNIKFLGTSLQNITTSTTINFYDAEITNASGVKMVSGNVQINNILTLTNGALQLNLNTLIVNNNSDVAIARNGTTQTGYIISEDENSKVQWNISTSTGNYVYPFGRFSSALRYIPFGFNVTTDGIGSSGSVTLATYHTVSNNTPYPSTVSNLNTNGSNNSLNVLDRFWIITPASYTSDPTATITFNYEYVNSGDNEFYSPNTITESDLQAQRWSGTQWEPPIGLDNTSNHYVQVTGVNTFSPWVLVTKEMPLPIDLINFDVSCQENGIKLEWVTASETNNDYFTIERSEDAVNFIPIGTVDGAGTSNTTEKYTYFYDVNNNSTAYYRIKQTDYDGTFSYSPFESIECNESLPNGVSLFPNPAGALIKCEITSSENTEGLVRFYNSIGQIVITQYLELFDGNNKYSFDLSDLKSGVYYIIITNENGSNYKNKITVIK